MIITDLNISGPYELITSGHTMMDSIVLAKAKAKDRNTSHCATPVDRPKSAFLFSER